MSKFTFIIKKVKLIFKLVAKKIVKDDITLQKKDLLFEMLYNQKAILI